MAYADFTGKVIKHSWGRFRATAGEAVYRGDLIDKDFKVADATNTANQPAKYIACEDIANAAVGWFCLKAEIMKPSTIGTGGVVTRANHGGTAGDTLFLSTTEGDAVEVPVGDGIGQMVGQVLSQDTVLLEPSPKIDYLMELEVAAKTLDVQSVGKVFYATATSAVVFTLPNSTTSAAGLVLEIVNCGQDGDAAIQASPATADKIMGPSIAGADDKDLINTSGTMKCGDRVRLTSDATDGWFVTEIHGIWDAET